MKIKEIKLRDFKRFTDLTIRDIPDTVKLVVLLGKNGCGKTSVFDAMQRFQSMSLDYSPWWEDNKEYFSKLNTMPQDTDNINITLHEGILNRDRASTAFSFRTAYRNEADLSIEQISKQEDITKFDLSKWMSHNESIVSKNYQYMVAKDMETLYKTEGEDLTRFQIVGELRNKINHSLENIFGDLTFTSVGNLL